MVEVGARFIGEVCKQVLGGKLQRQALVVPTKLAIGYFQVLDGQIQDLVRQWLSRGLPTFRPWNVGAPGSIHFQVNAWTGEPEQAPVNFPPEQGSNLQPDENGVSDK